MVIIGFRSNTPYNIVFVHLHFTSIELRFYKFTENHTYNNTAKKKKKKIEGLLKIEWPWYASS